MDSIIFLMAFVGIILILAGVTWMIQGFIEWYRKHKQIESEYQDQKQWERFTQNEEENWNDFR